MSPSDSQPPDPRFVESKKQAWSRRRILLCASVILVWFMAMSVLMPWLYFSIKRAGISKLVEEDRAWWLSLGDEAKDADNRYLAVTKVTREPRDSGMSAVKWLPEEITKLPSLGDRWPEQDTALREAIIPWEKILDKLRHAASLPGFKRPESFATTSDPESIFPERPLSEMYFLDIILSYRAWREMATGDWDSGSRDLLAAVRHSVDAWDGGSVLDSAFASAVLRGAAAPIQDTVTRNDLLPNQLRWLADRLTRELVRMKPLSVSLRTERLRLMLFFEIGVSPDYNRGTHPWPRRVLESWISTVGARRLHERMGQLMEFSDLPYPKSQAACVEAKDWFRDRSVFNMAANMHLPGLIGLKRQTTDAVGAMEVAIAALRARAVRLESGAYPQSSQELAEIDGRRVPMDPYTGGPLSWRSEADKRVVIYNVGRNLRDDYGVSREFEGDRAIRPMATDKKMGPRRAVTSWDSMHPPDDYGIRLN